MSYQLATSPDLHSLEKQQNVDQWKTASMHAQTCRSMDAACTGVWKTEVSQWGPGAGTRWGLGTKYKSSKIPQKTDVDYIHNFIEGTLNVMR